MEHEFNLFRLPAGICPEVTLMNHISGYGERGAPISHHFTFNCIDNFEEDMDTIQFTSYEFIDADKIDYIKIVYPVNYQASNLLSAGKLTKYYCVEYMGWKLNTNWGRGSSKGANITYYFKKVHPEANRHHVFWEFYENDAVKEYLDDIKAKREKGEKEEELANLQEKVNELVKNIEEDVKEETRTSFLYNFEQTKDTKE